MGKKWFVVEFIVIMAMMLVASLVGSHNLLGATPNTTTSASSVDEVINLCNNKVPATTIITFAKMHPASNMTSDQIIAVNNACQSPEVLNALMATGANPSLADTTPAQTNGKGGFFLVSNGQQTELQAALFRRTGFKIGKFGIAGMKSVMKGAPKMTAEITGERASIRVPAQPEFVTGFKDEFYLVKLETKKSARAREAIVGTGGLFGSRGGFDDKKLVPFQKDGASGKITFSRPLEPGEYAFYPVNGFRASGEASLDMTGEAYTFGVD